jgi:hypothetical protein
MSQQHTTGPEAHLAVVVDLVWVYLEDVQAHAAHVLLLVTVRAPLHGRRLLRLKLHMKKNR